MLFRRRNGRKVKWKNESTCSILGAVKNLQLKLGMKIQYWQTYRQLNNAKRKNCNYLFFFSPLLNQKQTLSLVIDIENKTIKILLVLIEVIIQSMKQNHSTRYKGEINSNFQRSSTFFHDPTIKITDAILIWNNQYFLFYVLIYAATDLFR